MVRVDPAVEYYDPHIYGADGKMTYELKPFDQDPRCLFGWGPPRCIHKFGHCCSRELGHKGRCIDNGTPTDLPCRAARRPSGWDTGGRAEANR
jgi:hypothetical protein